MLFEISHRFIDHFYDEGKIESEGREKSLRFYGPGLLINFVCVWSDQREKKKTKRRKGKVRVENCDAWAKNYD